MKWFATGLAVFVLFLFQDGVLAQFGSGLVYINLALVFLGLSVLLGSFKESLVAALVTGFFMDLNSGYTDALMMGVVLLVFATLHIVLNRFVTRQANLSILYGSAALSTLLLYFFLWLLLFLLRISGLAEMHFGITPGKLFWELALNSLLTYPVFLYYNYINSMVDRHLPKTL